MVECGGISIVIQLGTNVVGVMNVIEDKGLLCNLFIRMYHFKIVTPGQKDEDM